MATDPTFGEQLKLLRESAGTSQYALAKKSRVTAQPISKLESGESEPAWVTVRKLARALGVTVDKFDTDDDPRGPSGDADNTPPPSPKKPAPKKPKR